MNSDAENSFTSKYDKNLKNELEKRFLSSELFPSHHSAVGLRLEFSKIINSPKKKKKKKEA